MSNILSKSDFRFYVTNNHTLTLPAKRTSVVEVDLPWGNTTVERNLPALKFFHDFSCGKENLYYSKK